MASKIAVVTGSNKGIGYCIAKQLAEKQYHVVLTARDPTLGNAAVDSLKKGGLSNVEFAQLDITKPESAKELANHLKTKFNGIDVLVNNAAIAWKGDAFDENVAKTTIGTNYFATLSVCDHLFPLVREGGRIVNVSSSAGLLKGITKDSLRDEFQSANLTVSRLSELMNKFIDDVAKNVYSAEGWPKSTYGVSKIGLTALTKVHARDESLKKRNILINACCPGYCKTDMSSMKGTRSADDGATTPVWLATLPADSKQTGTFCRDMQEITW